MSCGRGCFDPEDKLYGYEDCKTCPDRDDGAIVVKVNDTECVPWEYEEIEIPKT